MVTHLWRFNRKQDADSDFGTLILLRLKPFDFILLLVLLLNNLEGKEVTPMLFLPREEGQGLVEYALILVLVAIVVIAILLLLGPVVGNVFSNIVGNL